MNMDGWLQRLRRIAGMGLHFKFVHGGLPIGDKFRAIRQNYRTKQKLVDAGLSSWFQSDPYQIADWFSIFTPIEASLWTDIRVRGLALWPQLPVGKFFVDFGNPVAKVAVECDGAAWHDPVKDAARDRILAEQGWTVYRVPGWMCKREVLSFAEAVEAGHVATRDEFTRWRRSQTPDAILLAVADRLDSALARSSDA